MSTNSTMTNGSKKRKASELDSDLNARSSKAKPSSRPKATKSSSKMVEEIPFSPECPYKPSKKQNDDVFVQKEEIAPGFEFEFAVRPGSTWKNMRSYRNVKLQDHTFSIGTVIYINKQVPPPQSLPPDATDAEILKYDRTNFWVGRIADTRAESHKAVFLRVYWLYWPEELPMGRQPYHGDRELVLSNAMDIVDAQTISGAADLTHWDEKDTTHLYQDRFWRQTFDISKLGKDNKGGLSELRKHCQCQQPHNPDKTMYQCKRPSCMTWNHEECLVKETLQKAWSLYEKTGTLDEMAVSKTKDGESETSLGHRLLTPVRQLGKMMQNKMTPSMTTVIEQSSLHTVDEATNGTPVLPKKGRPPKKAATPAKTVTTPWGGKLNAHIVNTEDKDDDSPILMDVEELSSEQPTKENKVWRVHVNCLICEHIM